MLGGVVHRESDEVLVAAVREGDLAAFSALYAAHVGAVRMAVRDNVHERETVDDVVQEVFARALERLASLRQADRFRPWLLSIARHTAIDERRARGRCQFDDDEPLEDLAGTRLGPGEEAELTELCELVNGSVAGLSRRDATALSLSMHLGYSPPEVAAVLGVTEGAAKVLLHRARHRLRDAVACEVLVRSQSSTCPEFSALLQIDDRIASVRHVRGCQVCQHAAGEEVKLYEMPSVHVAGHDADPGVTAQVPPPGSPSSGAP